MSSPLRLLQLTPGTGSFHCGSCLRDNSLVLSMRRLGHDAAMLPMYLPLVVDQGQDASNGHRVVFGGINVYAQEHSALFRWMPRVFDRLLDAPFLLRLAGKRAGMTEPHELGDLTVSMLMGEDGRQRKEVDKLIDLIAHEPRPQIVSLSNAMLLGLARPIKRRLGLKVICSLQGEDTFLDSLPEAHRDRAWKVLAERACDVDAFVAISKYYGNLMQKRMHLPAEKVHVIHNGIDPAPYSSAAPASLPNHSQAPTIGFLSRLGPVKGLHTLVEAFIILRREKLVTVPVKLHAAGAMTPADEPFLQQMRTKLRDAGLEQDATFSPNLTLTQKVQYLRSLQVLSVPATYGEAFGLYLLEAMASGVAVVQPEHAAFPELLEATGGGLLCKPDDPRDLAIHLAKLLNDEPLRISLAQRGRAAVLENFTADQMARRFSELCQHVLNDKASNQPRPQLPPS